MIKFIVLWVFLQTVPKSPPTQYDEWGNVIPHLTLEYYCETVPVNRYKVFNSSTVANDFYITKLQSGYNKDVELYEMRLIKTGKQSK